MITSDIKAINVVILPSDNINKLAISLSERLKNSSPMILNSDDYLPHITLAMGYVNDLQLTIERMNQVFKKTGPFKVVVEDIIRSKNDFNGYYFWHLTIRKNSILQELHKELVSTLPFINVDQSLPEAYFRKSKEEDISATVFNYVNSFKNKTDAEDYDPHITLGAGHENQLIKPSELPEEFLIDTIHLCQVGNYCTCRKVLV